MFFILTPAYKVSKFVPLPKSAAPDLSVPMKQQLTVLLLADSKGGPPSIKIPSCWKLWMTSPVIVLLSDLTQSPGVGPAEIPEISINNTAVEGGDGPQSAPPGWVVPLMNTPAGSVRGGSGDSGTMV